MTAVPPRYAAPLLVALVLALLVVARFTWSPPQVDDCANPSTLMDPSLLGGDPAPRGEGALRPDRIAGVVRRGGQALPFQILRSFGLPGLLLRPTAVFADRREPYYRDREWMPAGGSLLPVSFTYEEIEAVRITAYTFFHGPEATASPFLARVLSSPQALVRGTRPITLVAISGIAQPGLLDPTKALLKGWIADAWEHYQRVCGS